MVKGMMAVGYIRVSTREQGDSGHGLDAQETAIRDACARRGWVLSHIERDVISTRKVTRAGLDRAIASARDSGGILLAAKASRIARSTMELLAVHARAEREGWFLLTLDMEQIDTTTPLGKMMRTVLAAFNEFEREMISERTREGLAAAREKGVGIGRPRATNQTKRPEEAERMGAAIARIRKDRKAGLSLRAIAAGLNADGMPGPRGGRWTANTVMDAHRRYIAKRPRAKADLKRGGAKP